MTTFALKSGMRQTTAEYILQQLSEPGGDNLFLFLGRTTNPFPNDGELADYPTYAIPVDSVSSDTTIFRNIIALKALTPTNIFFMVPRVDWSLRNEPFSQYSESQQTNNVVFTANFRVYKCISNNYGALSTSQPNQIFTDRTFMTPDGYVWKYLYTIPDYLRRYITEDLIPLQPEALYDVEASNTLRYDMERQTPPGSIDRIDNSRGFEPLLPANTPLGNFQLSGIPSGSLFLPLTGASSYTNHDVILENSQIRRIVEAGSAGITLDAPTSSPLGFLSAVIIVPGIDITGDGSGARAYLDISYNIETNQKNLLGIIVLNPGSKYTHAEVTPTIVIERDNETGVEFPILTPTISPWRGHGKNLNADLNATRVLLTEKFMGNENIVGLDNRNDFFQFGIIRNPKRQTDDPAQKDIYGTSVIPAESNTKYLFDIMVESNSSSNFLDQNLFEPGKYVLGIDSKSTAEIVQFSSSQSGQIGKLLVQNVRGKFLSGVPGGMTGEALAQFSLSDETIEFSPGTFGVARVGNFQIALQDQISTVYDCTTRLEITGSNIDTISVEDTTIYGFDGETPVCSGTLLASHPLTGGNAKIVLINVKGTFEEGFSIWNQLELDDSSPSIVAVSPSEIEINTGQILYAQNVDSVRRHPEQVEEFQILLGF